MTASQSTGRKKDGVLSAIGCLSMYMPVYAFAIIAPALAYFVSDYYPNMTYAEVSFLSTVIVLATVPGSLLAGAIAGKKIRFKPLVLISLLIAAIAGFVPYFNHDFTFVLVTRAIMGFGIGMLEPLMDAIVLRLFKGARATTVQGLGMALMMVMGIVYQVLSAAAITVNLDYVWLIYLIYFIPVILVALFMPEPDKVAGPAKPAVTEGEEAPKKLSRVPSTVWILCSMALLWNIFFYPATLTASGIVVAENLGGPAEIALIGSMYTAGGIIGALLYTRLYVAAGKAFWPLTLIICTAGIGIYGFGHSIVALCAGLLLLGIAVSNIQPGICKWLFERIGSERIATATGLFRAFTNFGGFLASPFMVLAATYGGADLRISVIWGFAGMVVLSIVWIIYTRAKHNDLYKEDGADTAAVTEAA